MTTPTPAPMTYPPHPCPGRTPQPAPARSRRRLVAGVVALLLVGAGAAAAVRWAGGGDSAPLAGRPRVDDSRAGLSYAVPEGWKHDAAADKKLIGAFSSQISEYTGTGDDATGGTVMAGPAGKPVPRAELGRAADSAARSNAEFFFPDLPAGLEESHDTVVDGQPAHTTVLRIRTEDGIARLRLTVVTIHGERTSFLLGLATGGADPAVARDMEAVLGSARVG
ncbi:hypothetical protein [Streptomyces naphthomycinicus]|uniref:hypothetical protein n=1 Tax=Streptomyces naphthomycinicus TaxID=2872625 RepID=UPI001CECA0F4|nr:hypothetical protein [Streptomyces sp. TML10]